MSVLTRTIRATLLAVLTLSTSGCYYGELASGQLRMLWRREAIESVRADPDRPASTRDLLGLVESVRDFARGLGLDVGSQYKSYVEWPGDRVVTTLVRTRPGSLEPVPWRYPLLGRLPYRGYFDRAKAEAEALRLREREGFDVCETGVTAYSTLGWLADPVTSPMLERGPASLVETLLHELVHATAFLPDAADFNESVAQFVGQQATIRFFDAVARGEVELPPELAWPEPSRVRAHIEDRRLIAESVLAFRDRLAGLEGAADRDAQRDGLEQEARALLRALPLAVLEPERVAEAARLSDACLALSGTYARELPRHEAVYRSLGEDLEAMIARLVRLAEEKAPTERFFEEVPNASAGD
ncbi:MAG TPA: aminopeptidase [Myxococcota bacterium]|nr:aminopeptidase [Myxococcota bacterium]